MKLAYGGEKKEDHSCRQFCPVCALQPTTDHSVTELPVCQVGKLGQATPYAKLSSGDTCTRCSGDKGDEGDQR